MDPVTLGVGAGTQLIGGFFDRMAKKREQERQRAYELERQGNEAQMAGVQNLGKNQMSSFDNLMAAYGRVFGR